MKKIVSALLFCALLLSLAACSQKSPTAQETEPESSAARTVTDSFGREVTIPAEVKAIVCTGSGALRMVTYLQCTDRLVGVEDCDKEYADSTLRDYAYVYHDTFDALPSIGKGGGTANTAEAVAAQGLPEAMVYGSWQNWAIAAFTLAVAAAAPSHRSDRSSKLPMPCSVRKFSVSAARFKFSMVAQCL